MRSLSRPASLSRSPTGYSQTQLPVAPLHVDHHRLVHAVRVQVDAQLTAVLHSLAVERQDEVTRLQPGAGGRPTGRDIRQHDSGITRDAERLGQERRNRLRVHPDIAPAHTTGLANLGEDVADDVARRGEADAFVPAGLGIDERADAHQAPLGIDQRPAAVPGIDRRVGLDVDHRVFRRELPRDGAHHPEGDRGLEPERAAEGQHDLPRAQRL